MIELNFYGALELHRRSKDFAALTKRGEGIIVTRKNYGHAVHSVRLSHSILITELQGFVHFVTCWGAIFRFESLFLLVDSGHCLSSATLGAQ